MDGKKNYYLILLGGTGAKCGEILIHMCANGYLECDRLTILYIDSDMENGNAKQLKGVIDSYIECQKKYRIQKSSFSSFFKPEIEFQKQSPVEGYNRFRDLAIPSGQDAAKTNSAEILMRALYSEEEQNMKISEGFFAHPNVGAAFFAANIDKILDGFCHLIEDEPREIGGIKIFVIGSIFGGTGASSLPTITKYLKKKLVGESDNRNIDNQVKIGGCMMLPYFSFSRENIRGKILFGEDVSIEADKFATKTRSALKYYKYVDGKQDKNIFDCLYILGHDRYDVRGYYQTAGAAQKNMPHITEFYSAMSAVDFFDHSMEQRGRFFAVIPADIISWSNIYRYPKGFFHFFVMMRFALVLKNLILEELFDFKNGNKLKEGVKNIAWYFDFLDGREKSPDMEEDKLYGKFAAISEYCDHYIRWFAELNISNIKKKDDPGEIEFDRSDNRSDVVEYLQFFDKELIIKQYYNNRIVKGDVKEKNSEIYDDIYHKNVEYIREHFTDLEKYHGHTDARTEKIGMDKIWSRICDLGFNSTLKDNDLLQNMTASSDKSMEAGVRNLINAIYIACLN